MPRLIVGANSSTEPAQLLIHELEQELLHPRDQPLPFILERHIPVTKSRHVYVIWDRWGDLDPEERTAVIIQAYENAEGVGTADNISVALGVRPQEARVFGLVPYLVQPVHAQFGERTDYRRALSQETPHTILGENARELCYTDEAAAKRALDRLKQTNPETSWIIHHEVAEED